MKRKYSFASLSVIIVVGIYMASPRGSLRKGGGDTDAPSRSAIGITIPLPHHRQNRQSQFVRLPDGNSEQRSLDAENKGKEIINIFCIKFFRI
jgi:hypothetical protein